MASPSILGIVENPMVLEATLCSSFPIFVLICGVRSVSSNGGLRLGNVLPALCDISVYSLLPCEASPPPSIVVSSGGPIMESLSSLLLREVSPPPSVVIYSGSLVMESLSSSDPSKSVEQTFWEHEINSYQVVQSDSSLTDSQAKLGFVTVAP
ncbi:hypothetical protein LWI29_004528 [Acer saccharum]|uniref:Uncharacterized protein n=1 Tax=Acer saccharum TaxID=4024 RepID=A0AA39VQ04_ACESA|nr:hypothetical protein LWI29_004528 [Acer saccharum]